MRDKTGKERSAADEEVEMALLGAMMLCGDLVIYKDCFSQITEHCFLNPWHWTIFNGIKGAFNEYGAVDPVIVASEMRLSNQKIDYLYELVETCPVAYHCNIYAKIVADRKF